VLNIDLNSRQKEFDLVESEFLGSNHLLNPFPGLRPFGIDECHLFFGREGQVDEVLVKLAENRFVSVLGYSGSGKSSLMYCGLIPILYGGFMTQTGANWNVIVTRPGQSPLDNLAEALIKHDPEYSASSEEDKLIKRTIASSILRGGSSGLIDIARQYNALTGDNLLIMVDQFEELFRFQKRSTEADNETSSFIRLLYEAVKQEDVPLYIALTMRSDYVANCAQFNDLTELINDSNYVIPKMTREQKRMAIEGPVAVGGGRIAPRLVKRLLSEIGDKQDQLPIMQHALMRTWDYWREHREHAEVMDVRHYNAVGRIEEALSQHADEAFDQLSDKYKKIAEVLFKNLTEKTSEGLGIRRPSTIREVSRIAETDEADVIEVVDHFRQPGLSLLMPAPNVELTSTSIIEISHESLMRIWTRLHNWVEEESESAEMYMRISEAAALYQIGRTGLWRPPDLQLALNWQKKQAPTRYWAQRYDEAFERAIVFLDTSRITYEAEQKNQELMQQKVLRRTRGFAAILGIAFIIAIALGIFALINQIQANENAKLAEERRIEAEGQAEKARIAQHDAEVAKGAAEKSAEEARAAEAATKLANEKLIESNKVQLRLRLAETAARQLADQQKIKAQKATEVAIAQTKLAEQKTEDANRLLHLVTAQSMAAKSLQVRSQKSDLKALLALQAFDFNKEYQGKQYDRFIYDGVYNAIATYEGENYNKFMGHRGPVKSIVFEPGTEDFFSTGSDGTIRKWNLNSTDRRSIIVGKTDSSRPNDGLEISPDKRWLVSSSDSASMEMYSMLDLNKPPVEIIGHRGKVFDFHFMPDGSGVISVGMDGTLRFFDFNRSRLLKQLEHPLVVFDITSNGDKLYGGSRTGELIEVSLDDMSERVLYQMEDKYPIRGLKINQIRNLIGFAGEDGLVRIFNMETGVTTNTLEGHTARINAIAFSNKGNLMASASWDGSVQLWNLDKIDDLPLVMKDHESYVWDVTFSTNDVYLVVGTKDGTIKRWPVEAEVLSDELTLKLRRNLTEDEWSRYVGNGIPHEETIPGLTDKSL